jgi:hypothetical protein
MGRIINAVVIFMITIGCAMRQAQQEGVFIQHVSSIVRYSAKQPRMIERADPACSSEKAVAAVGKHRIVVAAPGLTAGQSGGEKEIDFNFSQVSGRDLSSPYSLGVYFGRHVVVHHSDCVPEGSRVSGIYRCENREEEIKNPGVPVSICSAKTYKAESIENAALVATASLIKSGRLHELATKGAWNRDITLYILPTIENRIQLKDSDKVLISYNTDNAHWVARFNQKGTEHSLELMPHSKVYNALPYYLQMAVMSHEVGHYVFYWHAQDLQQADYNLSSDTDGDGDVDRDDLKTHVFKSHLAEAEREVSISLVKDAINEGFADAWSWYALSGEHNEIATLQLGSTFAARNVSSETDDHWNPKALDEATLKHFFLPKISRRSSNLVADHQDPHAIGAILAFAFHKLADSSQDSSEKAARLIQWAQQSNAVYLERKDFYRDNYEALLEAASFAMLKVHIKSSDAFLVPSQQQCKVLAQVFPLYMKREWSQKVRCG